MRWLYTTYHVECVESYYVLITYYHKSYIYFCSITFLIIKVTYLVWKMWQTSATSGNGEAGKCDTSMIFKHSMEAGAS